MEFAYDGGGLAKGGDVTLYYDGTAAGAGRVGATQPMVFSADETTDIGYESGTTVSPDYTAQPAGSPARSTGCRSTWERTTTTTSSMPRNVSASPWPGSRTSRHDRGRTQPLQGRCWRLCADCRDDAGRLRGRGESPRADGEPVRDREPHSCWALRDRARDDRASDDPPATTRPRRPRPRRPHPRRPHPRRPPRRPGPSSRGRPERPPQRPSRRPRPKRKQASPRRRPRAQRPRPATRRRAGRGGSGSSSSRPWRAASPGSSSPRGVAARGTQTSPPSRWRHGGPQTRSCPPSPTGQRRWRRSPSAGVAANPAWMSC